MDEQDTAGQPRFLVDENAARLVRWLRLLGCDTAFLPGVDDLLLVQRADVEGRVLLTRDRGIVARRAVSSGAVRALLLNTDDTWQQVVQVVRAFGLDPLAAPFTRCASCNSVLERVPREQAAGSVPPFVAATQTAFMRCPGCGRYYWRGTHWQRVSQRLASLAHADG